MHDLKAQRSRVSEQKSDLKHLSCCVQMYIMSILYVKKLHVTMGAQAEVVNESDCELPKKVHETLGKGPKYAVQVRAKPLELLAMVKTIAEEVPQNETEACAHNALNCVERGIAEQRNSVAPKATVQFLRDKDLKLLLSDKTGSFVVLNSRDYSENAMAEVQKHFRKSEALSVRVEEAQNKGEEVLRRSGSRPTSQGDQ